MGMSGLFTAVSGLQAAQANLYTTGHNMANSNVRGFTRQYVAQSTFLYRTIGRNAGGALQIGLGTNMTGIRQIRDRFLDMEWRAAAPQMHFWEVRYSTGLEMDAIFGEMEGQYRMQGVLLDFKAALNELVREPNSIAVRSNFIYFAGSFLTRAEDAARSMRAYQEQLNEDIRGAVQRINQLLTEIHSLNQRIQREEIGGANANDLRDWRNNAIDELSTLVDIQYTVDVRTGAYNIFTGGHSLLSGGSINHLGLRFSAPGSPFVEPVFTNSVATLPFDATGQNATALFNWERLAHTNPIPAGGALLSMLVSRGLSPVTHESAPPPTAAEILSSMMPDVRNDLVNWRDQIVANLTTLDNLYSGQLVLAPPLTANFVAEMTVILDTFISGFDNFLANPDTAPMPSLNLPAIAIDPGATPAQRDAIRALLGNIGTAAGQMNGVVIGARRNAGRHLFDFNHGVITRTHMQFDTMVFSIVDMFNTAFTTDVLGVGEIPQNMQGERGVPLFVQIRQGEGYVLGNLRLNPDLLGDGGPSRLSVNFSDAISGESEVRLASWMVDQWNSPDLIRFHGWVSMDVNTFYRNFITEMSLSTSEAGSAFRGTVEQMNFYDHRRLQVSGVSLEEEMSNMIRFQHAYNASARMINTLDSMLDRIINHMAAR